jgi:hypothetical protein
MMDQVCPESFLAVELELILYRVWPLTSEAAVSLEKTQLEFD